ncbi:uncharacterized protein LOC120529870 [Polypterus senegalus]|uniref:uncharacterized protein LOC120529870 n=1 Tax=Polypterus senegalus TaxID=55291 RepID=UPI001962430A|nr:uncharacterized protein LOC120529870 [Polypterus senegalus]
MGAKISPPPGYGPYCFRIHGSICHRAGTLHPQQGENRQFAQLYILDPSEAAEQRMQISANSGINSELMQTLSTFMAQFNPFAEACKMLYHVEKEYEEDATKTGNVIKELSMTIVEDRKNDQRRYNAPKYNEPTSFINFSNPRVRVTQMQYYGYRLSIREDFNPVLNAGRLTQQYIVDAYVKTEANRLNYICQNQPKLHVEKYSGLMDHLLNEANEAGLSLGKMYILPSSFAGSPRNMLQNYQDAMAIVRKYGKPDHFITMTCNPKWEEIVNNLQRGQPVDGQPHLVARVFHLKLKALIDDICKKHIFGVLKAIVYVIEFQKRGLPHAHILLILKESCKPKNEELIDKIVSAEIPNIEITPPLHAIVTKHMIHEPFGALNPNSSCMTNDKCSKDFPKEFQIKTIANSNGYPKYKRRNTGQSIILNGKKIDNSWVVPYNPYLALKYNCHINVEVCAPVKSVKYLFKYVYKGHDCANVVIQEQGTLNHDEIKTFINTRYVSSPEAAWRLNGFEMHYQSHTIHRLPVHLPEEQSLFFNPNDITTAVQRASNRDNQLTTWFKLNQQKHEAKTILYSDIPLHYVFDSENCTWKLRQRGAEKVIGRMYSVNFTSDTERNYGPGGSGKTYLYKTLLSTVRGQGNIALPVASTGIAANRLEGGRTYHSQFKLSVPILDNSISNMRLNSADAENLRSSTILIWDECTMAPSTALAVVDKLLKQIMDNHKLFGGKVFLLGGDFRQTLPVVPHDDRTKIVEVCIKYNKLWQNFQVLNLTNNIRSVDTEFSNWLIQLGNGDTPHIDGLPEDIIEMPSKILCTGDIIKDLFGKRISVAEVSKIAKKSILCPKNSDVDTINEEVLNILEGDTVTFLS